MTTLHCDHCMNLPCDAVAGLMVTTYALIYAIRYCICTYKTITTQYMYRLHNICLRCTEYTCSGVASELIYCINVYTGVTSM